MLKIPLAGAQMPPQSLVDHFVREFGAPPTHFGRAPGRVNVIGEHTDYNEGYVLPMALEQETFILGRRNALNESRLSAINLNARTTCSKANLERNPNGLWADYIIGILAETREMGWRMPEADIMVWGNVPLGCGLSSSASLEMAVLALIEGMLDLRLSDKDAALLGQRVENQFLGLSSGIMDQFICRAARAGHATFLDCRTLEHQDIPIGFAESRFVVVDSGVRRELTDSKYNERVGECARVVECLRAKGTPGTHLRDFDLDALLRAQGGMPDLDFRRARHVITENRRTMQAASALRQGDAAALGALMNASHDSLRDDYEVSCTELNFLVEHFRAARGCHGARMTGAGFGGCVVALLSSVDSRKIVNAVIADYGAHFGRVATGIQVVPGSGARGGRFE